LLAATDHEGELLLLELKYGVGKVNDESAPIASWTINCSAICWPFFRLIEPGREP
jgi:hypothetical protein